MTRKAENHLIIQTDLRCNTQLSISNCIVVPLGGVGFRIRGLNDGEMAVEKQKSLISLTFWDFEFGD